MFCLLDLDWIYCSCCDVSFEMFAFAVHQATAPEEKLGCCQRRSGTKRDDKWCKIKSWLPTS